jgi:WD repeat-containing protein 59
MLLYVP